MFDVIASVAFAMTVTAGVPAQAVETLGNTGTHTGVLSRAAASAASLPAETSRSFQTRGRDSFKNGAITGAVAGGLTVGLLASVGCAAGSALGGGEEGCGGAMLAGTAIGAGVGALIGIGVDALFERAPHPIGVPSGMRRGIRVRLQF